MAWPRRAATRRRGTGLVPGFEALEGRVVPSTITVTNANNDGGGSLRAAIELANTDPLLGPLADNGGPTLTIALLPGSPAIDAGRVVPGVTADQRGVPRPQGAAPDIGAFEVATAPFVRLTPVTATRLVGTSHSVTATVLDPSVRH